LSQAKPLAVSKKIRVQVKKRRQDLQGELAEEAYQLIKRASSSSGITQAALGRALRLDPKPTSRIVAKLLKDERLERQPYRYMKVCHTYRLKPTERGKKMAELLFHSPIGLLQSSFQKRSGSEKLARQVIWLLEKLGWLEREPVRVSQQRRTFLLKAVHNPLASIADVPCAVCFDIDKCCHSPDVDPTSCTKLERWLNKLS